MTIYTQDNREITSDSIFIALPGLERDGHIFIENALKRGAKKIVFHDESYKSIIPKNKQIFVLDTEEWLVQQTQQKIKKAKIITICGSVGKTTTTKLTHHLLANLSKKTVFTPRYGINTLRGICLEILNKYKNENLIVLETAMDSYLELDKVGQIFKPTINAVVSIDISHFEKLKSLSRILRTEFGICTSPNLQYLIVSNDKNINKFLKSDYKMLIKNKDFTPSKIIKTKDFGYKIEPKHFSNNLNIALEILNLINPKTKNIQNLIDVWEPVSQRFETLKSKDKTILNDCYNAAPLSFKAFFYYSKKIKVKKLGIIGQINEIGSLSEKYHKEIYENAITTFDECIFVGKDFSFLKKKNIVKDYKEAIALLEKRDLSKYQFFGVKGSRGVALEHVTDYIKEYLHV